MWIGYRDDGAPQSWPNSPVETRDHHPSHGRSGVLVRTELPDLNWQHTERFPWPDAGAIRRDA